MSHLRFRFLRVAAAVLTLASLAACSSKKDDPQAPTGMSWTADGTASTDSSPQIVASSTNIDIIGSTGTAPNNATIHVGAPAQVGTYPITSTGAATADYIQRGGTATISYLASTGTVSISTLTANRVTGSFSFTAYNYSGGVSSPLVKTVTNGRFDVAR
ncbi:hypothetical protein KB206_18560 [Microvirga sp. STS02]|uniref:DUF6252 family protein n=1 Tax=Hymenobacter negativus TaxID=2795026 RepID=UPI0018DDF11D|nr:MULTISPECIES: DUF6252 family protein [Bacteria]MBH8570900.1 hypothetical protein [Hymenobacter negativus]MBR7210638.1 hypothetical protein [Microvirga sp. STS02]